MDYKKNQCSSLQHGERKSKEHTKECAVALKGDNEVFKIENYPEWLKTGDKEDVIIFEDCDRDWLETKYIYWEHTINYKKYAV